MADPGEQLSLSHRNEVSPLHGARKRTINYQSQRWWPSENHAHKGTPRNFLLLLLLLRNDVRHSVGVEEIHYFPSTFTIHFYPRRQLISPRKEKDFTF